MDGTLAPSAPGGWSVSLVIPAYNEAEGIRQAVTEAFQALSTSASQFEVLVVDDGSHDATAAIVARLAAANPSIRLLRHQHNRGYSAALRTGFKAARFERVAFTDADCQFHLKDLTYLLDLSNKYDLAVGYRLKRQDPWQRRFYSWGYNVLARALLGTGVKDCDCALKVFRKEAVRRLLPRTHGFFVNSEMLSRARQIGLSVAEAGVRHRPRASGKSKVSLGDIPRTLRSLIPFWWSRVLFVSKDRSCDIRQPLQPSWDFLALFVVAMLLFFSRLGCPLQEPEEPRYAEIPRQMLEAGSLAVPMLHGLPYYDKPPLLYWLVMGSYRIFGVHDWSARLVPSLAGFLCVLVTYGWTMRIANRRAAFAAGMMLCLSPRFVYLGRLLTMNSLLCFCILSSLAAAHLAIHRRHLRWGWWLLSALICSLGVLTKGPVALLLVAVPCLLFCFLDHRAACIRLQGWMIYLSVVLVVASPWFLLLGLKEPDFWSYFFWRQNLLRYLAPFDHAGPVWYYAPDLLIGMLPWSLLLFPLGKYLIKRPGGSTEGRPAALGFVLLSAVVCFFFFSCSGSKRHGYILPAMPVVAMMLGLFLDRSMSLTKPGWLGDARIQPTRLLSSRMQLCGVLTFLALFAGIQCLLPAHARQYSLRGPVRSVTRLEKTSDLPAVCFPRGWDSVNFYLGREVRVYGPGQKRELIESLKARDETLAFIKADHSLDELLRDLPGSLEFVRTGRQGYVAVGVIRPRREAPPTLFAGHSDDGTR